MKALRAAWDWVQKALRLSRGSSAVRSSGQSVVDDFVQFFEVPRLTGALLIHSEQQIDHFEKRCKPRLKNLSEDIRSAYRGAIERSDATSKMSMWEKHRETSSFVKRFDRGTFMKSHDFKYRDK